MALAHAASAEKIHVRSLVLMPPDAKTSALVKTSTFETVHLILRAGATIPPHSVAGYITLYGHSSAGLNKKDCIIDLKLGNYLDC